jgi:putative FmdB family regulatory protein
VPVYQYACTECGHRLEVRQSFTDDALTDCPACSGRLRKVLGAVGVVFKGSGFYRTDSRKEAASSSDTSKADASTSASASGSPSESTSGSTGSDKSVSTSGAAGSTSSSAAAATG